MEREKTFEIHICKKCKGKCCHEGSYVTNKEYELLPKRYKKFKELFRYIKK